MSKYGMVKYFARFQAMCSINNLHVSINQEFYNTKLQYSDKVCPSPRHFPNRKMFVGWNIIINKSDSKYPVLHLPQFNGCSLCLQLKYYRSNIYLINRGWNGNIDCQYKTKYLLNWRNMLYYYRPCNILFLTFIEIYGRGLSHVRSEINYWNDYWKYCWIRIS